MHSPDRLAILRSAQRLLDQGALARALATLEPLLTGEPPDTDAHTLACVAHAYAGRARDAVTHARLAARGVAPGGPGEGQVRHNLGAALAAAGHDDEAVEELRRAVALLPRDGDALLTLAETLRRAGRFAEAREACEGGLRLGGEGDGAGRARLAALLVRSTVACGRADEALREAALLAPRGDERSDPGGEVALGAAWAALCAPGQSAAQVRALQEHTAERVSRAARAQRSSSRIPMDAPPAKGRAPGGGERLRVGLIGPGLAGAGLCAAGAASIAPFVGALLEAADPRLEFACYMTRAREDDVSDRLRQRTVIWRNVAHGSDADVASVINADGVDVLVDIGGYADGARPGVLARRAAPVQVAWPGWPVPAGASAGAHVGEIDARFGDSATDPVSASGAGGVGSAGAGGAGHARVLRLDPCAWCWSPAWAGGLDASSAVAAAVGAPRAAIHTSPRAGGVTFACVAPLERVTGEALRVWARLLRRVRSSRLLLACAGLGDARTRADLLARLTAQGVERERVEFAGGLDARGTASTGAHERTWSGALSAALARADVVLDTFPCNDPAGACAALHAGVPVVTLAGEPGLPHARATLSVLRSASRSGALEALAAREDAQEYLEIAEALAEDATARAELRRTLRPTMLASALCDARAYGARFADALLALRATAHDAPRAPGVAPPAPAVASPAPERPAVVSHPASARSRAATTPPAAAAAPLSSSLLLDAPPGPAPGSAPLGGGITLPPWTFS